MKWTEPEDDSQRTVRKFLWLPKVKLVCDGRIKQYGGMNPKFTHQKRWLEFAKWTETYSKYTQEWTQSDRWLDWEDWDAPKDNV